MKLKYIFIFLLIANLAYYAIFGLCTINDVIERSCFQALALFIVWLLK